MNLNLKKALIEEIQRIGDTLDEHCRFSYRNLVDKSDYELQLILENMNVKVG